MKITTFVLMFSRKKMLLTGLCLLLLFGFKQADDYFEISKNIEIFGAVYKSVHQEYVDEVKPGDLMKKGIDAMLASLDPYTNFYTESQAEDALIRQSGEYGGIGCRSKKAGEFICITSVFKGMAADKAGLRTGDRILEINGKSFKGKTDEEAGEALKGSPGSKVSMVVERQGRTLQLEIAREEIKIKNVTYFGQLDAQTGYIRLDHFTNGAAAEVKEALLKLKAQGIQGLILDLRDNGGGLLHEAVNIVNIFVPADELVVVSRGKSKEAYREYKTLDAAVDTEIPLVVLINKNSASASEIVSGAIQDLDRGVVIGRNSFGKGLVQSVRPLVYRTQMKVTIAKYYIPSGRCIQLLDYSRRDAEGKALATADSLRKQFRTRAGRTVLDGGGVRPDLMTSQRELSEIASVLEKNMLVFDFASMFRDQKEDIGDIRKFKVGDEIFESFKQFVSAQAFTPLRESEKAFFRLKESLEKDSLTGMMRGDLEKLESSMKKARESEINRNKEEICKLLHTEICRRYAYDDAVFIIGFGQDEDILKASATLKDRNTYRQILNKL